MAIKSDIRIISRVVPRERDGKYVPRSVTIIQGGGGGGDVTNADHANSAYTLDEDTPVHNWFLSALNDDDAQGIINFFKGLKIAGNLVSRIVKQGDKDVTYTDEDVMSALRVMTEIENSAEKLKEIFLRKDVADSTKFLLSMFAGAVFGKNGFASGLTGFGAKIFDTGHGEFESMFIRRFLEVPELRYNRVMVMLGDKWRAPGAGIIETVDTGTKTCTLKLEDGEIGAVAVGDICMGIYHNITGNATEDYDDGKGNRRFAGFCTVYFTITEVTGERNEAFKYQLRPTSSSWSSSFDPFEMMNFVAYGNFTDTDRQTSVYETRTYTRMLWKQNTWEISAANVALQYGDLSNLNIFGMNMDGYSMYLNNVYFTGTVTQMKPDGTPVRTLNFREEGYIPGIHYDYYDSLSYNGSMWACINEDGSSAAPGSNGDWLEIASKGDQGSKGDKGDGYTQMGQFKTGMVVPKMGVVSMGGGSYVAKASTTNPPLWCWTDNAGNRFTFADGGYVLTGEVNTAEYDVLAEPGRDGTDGINGTDGVPGTPGKDGKTYYTWIRYADDAQGNGISNDPTGKAYIGLAYNKETAVESNNPSDYKWSDIKGEPGVPGAVGADGKTYYTWIAYSDNADGSGMYQQPNDNTKYIGIAVNKETATESSNPADYTWSQFKGDKGDGYTQMGQFKTGMVVPKMGVVSMGGGSYVAKASTTNPPLWCWTDNAGNRFTFADGGYVLTGGVNTAEYDVWAEKGEPGKDGTDGKDGEDGKDGKPGEQGKQGLQGCILRQSEWRNDGVEYRNDESLTSGTRYIDVVVKRDNGTATGWRAYKCLQTHTSNVSNGPGNTSYWIEFGTNSVAVFTGIVIAKNGKITFLQSNQFVIQKDNGTVTAGMSGSESGQKIRIWAGSDTPDSAPFRVDEEGNVVATKANITGTITATGGNVGGFSISSSSMESVSGDDSMLLSANLIRFTGSYSKVFMGAETMPSSNGGSFSTPVRIEVNRSIQSMSYGNAGLFLSVEGSHAYDNKDYQFTGNHALYISKGDICGFRLRLRRIDESTILSVMDSVVLAIKAGITLTVPSTAEDGQFYWIRNISNGDVTIAGTNLVGWNSGEVSTSIGLAKSKAAAMYYDKYNNKWFMNWIDCWN